MQRFGTWEMIFGQVHIPLTYNERERDREMEREGERAGKKERERGAYSETGERKVNLICLLHLYLTHLNGLVLGSLQSKIQ